MDSLGAFRLADRVVDAISNSCVPQIAVSTEVATVAGKTVVVVAVPMGMSCPYYVKSLGRENGIFVRVGATTRLADENKVKELELVGAGKSVDTLPCRGIQVALYDTHLDIVSPGGLPHGMTVRMMEEGHSLARNKALALACRYMRIIEEWGSGIPRIQGMLASAGLRPLEIIDNGINLQFRVWRPAGNSTTGKTTDKTTEKAGGKQMATEKTDGPTEKKLLKIVADNPSITMRDLATRLGITEDGVFYHVKNLRGVLKRVGGRKIGHWEVIKS